MPEGLLLVNKPAGMTSHDVVLVLRRKLGIRRIGHAGTLDPMAEGLLILLIGGATKSQQVLQGHTKVYDALVRLGAQTDTADAAGAVIRTAPVPPIERARVEETLASFRGPLSQTPPAYSAVKVRGKPAYWWTRRERPVELAARTVHLLDLSLLEVGPDTIRFRVRCSAGTYVRAFAESLAERLGTVGHLAALTRLQVGEWRLDDAKPLAWFEQAAPDAVARALRPVGAACP
jgi:tRNA pseudouridine55 synthase